MVSILCACIANHTFILTIDQWSKREFVKDGDCQRWFKQTSYSGENKITSFDIGRQHWYVSDLQGDINICLFECCCQWMD